MCLETNLLEIRMVVDEVSMTSKLETSLDSSMKIRKKFARTAKFP